MTTAVIVKVKVLSQRLAGLFGMGVIMQIDFFIFHAAPQPLGEDVVESAAFAIHTDLNLSLL